MSLIRGRKAHTLFLTGRVLFLTVSLGFAVLAIMATPRMTLLTPSTQAPTLVAKGSNRTNDEGVIEWTQTFGGFDWDRGEWVEQTADGGYIITGIIDHADVWLIKTDAHGHAEWNQTYGGPHTDWGYCVAQTTDGGYIITGSTGRTSVQGEPSSKGGDLWLIKTDADGNAEWTQTYGNPFVDIHDRGEYVEQTADGGYIITGCFMAGDVWLIKTDADGNAEWTQIYGGYPYDDVGECVEQTADGGYIITGGTGYDSYIAHGGDVWLIKTDAAGNVIWNQTYGGPDPDDMDWGEWGKQTTDGGYIIIGWTFSYDIGHGDVWLIKTDADGNVVWNQTYGGPRQDLGECGEQTADGGYIITGETGDDVWLIKVSGAGVVTSPEVPETETVTSPAVSEVPRDSVFWAMVVLGVVLAWRRVFAKRKH